MPKTSDKVAKPNFVDKTIWTGDNLDILRGLNSETVDLIYLDPPFNSNKNYEAPVGSKAAGAAFKDAWTLSDLDVAWMGLIADEQPAIARLLDAARWTHGKGMQSYLTMMAVRLLEMRRILKATGSIYLHCDPTASHYLKQLMDAVFEANNFRNEIVWHYKTGGASKKWFARKHDSILFYAKDGNHCVFNPQKQKSYISHKYGFSNITIHKDESGLYTLVGMRDVWDIAALRGNQPETIGYPTQKPLALLERIVAASSNEGDHGFGPLRRMRHGVRSGREIGQAVGRHGPVASCLHAGSGTSGPRSTGRIEGIPPSDGLDRHTPHGHPRRTDIDAPKNYRQHKHVLYGQQEGRCGGCDMDFPFKIFEVDHVVPQSRGGGNHIENLQLLCGHCNRIKGDRPQEYLITQLKQGAAV